MSLFKPATRSRVYLKLGITGGPGDGKTTSALRLARGLANGGKIAVIDTENASASLYAESYTFDALNLEPPFSEDKFVAGLKDAVAEGYSVVIIDSLSHGWQGVLDYKANLDAKGGNSYTNWNVAGRKYNAILAAVLQSPIHVVCCLRSKMQYTLETDLRGKQVPKKIGMEPIARDGTEYEFGIVFDCGGDHCCTVSKDRTNLFIDTHFQITEETGRTLLDWLNSVPPAEPQPKTDPVSQLAEAIADLDPQQVQAFYAYRGLQDGVPEDYAVRALKALPQFRQTIEEFQKQNFRPETASGEADTAKNNNEPKG